MNGNIKPLSPSPQKLSAGLITKTERTLAERAGHLELLAGGKKQQQPKQAQAQAQGRGKTKDKEVGKSSQRQQRKSG
jgi:Protein of unknown function (DUF2462)